MTRKSNKEKSRFMKTTVLSLTCIAVGFTLLISCAVNKVPDGGKTNISFLEEPTCIPTVLKIEFVPEPGEFWKERLTESAGAATEILTSPDFGLRCQNSKMKRTNGKSVQEVCRELVCAGSQTVKFGFYEKKNTRAIAYEQNGIVYINTAKNTAGTPKNVAHEFTHTLGYTHFTNWAILGRGSVPYVVGGLVDSATSE